MAGSVIPRDQLINNLLDRIDQMEERIRILEATHPGLAGEAAGKLAYYRDTGDLVLPGGGADVLLGDQPLAFGRLISNMLLLPGLRGLWSANHFDTSGNLEDWTKYDLLLTRVGNPVYNYDGLVPYLDLDGTGDDLARNDEPALSITGTESHIDSTVRGLTVGGWFKLDDDTPPAASYLMSKWAAAPNNSWYLRVETNGRVRLLISDDGTNQDNVLSTATVSGWTFSVGRFCDNDSGEELAVWVNNVKATAATARASIFDGNGQFQIGALAHSGLMSGNVSLCFMCAARVSDDAISALFEQSRPLFGI